MAPCVDSIYSHSGKTRTFYLFEPQILSFGKGEQKEEANGQDQPVHDHQQKNSNDLESYPSRNQNGWTMSRISYQRFLQDTQEQRHRKRKEKGIGMWNRNKGCVTRSRRRRKKSIERSNAKRRNEETDPAPAHRPGT